MAGSVLGRRIAVILAAAALCVAAAGCAVNVGTTKSEGPEGSGQMRYFGGPKSPMWSGH
jgi:hypothetical protein